MGIGEGVDLKSTALPAFRMSAVVAFLVVNYWASCAAQAQSIKADRDRGQEILENLKKDLQQNYYDPTYHGMNVEARFKLAQERVKKAESNSEIFGIIAQTLVDLNDSHTYFLPPKRASRTDYGWSMQMVGDLCFVVEVDPKSDAAKKGLKAGDWVLSVDGYQLARENLWKFQYLYYHLKPRTGMVVTVKGSDEQIRELPLAARINEGKELMEMEEAEQKRQREEEKQGTTKWQPRCSEPSEEVAICKLPTFEIKENLIDDMMKKVKRHQALILDLRGNHGGSEETLKRLIGYFFDRELKIGDLKRRERTDSLKVKGSGDRSFTGRLSVLVDSESASASELFARVIQLEKRGAVIGDRTAGAVMRGRLYEHSYQRGAFIDIGVSFSGYAAMITDADIVMSDGKSLEGTGVLPDELILPKASDLANGWDPVISHAAALAGIRLSPKEAGSVFKTPGR